MSDGDGWTHCERGHRHWGLFGAAGLLLVTPDAAAPGRLLVLLQHRAPWSHHGDTWGIPGGARGSTESAEQAALRETVEETGLDAAEVTLLTQAVDDHGGWAYTTVRASARVALAVRPLDGESLALEWVPADEVALRPLHPGFAGSWGGHLAVLRDAG